MVIIIDNSDYILPIYFMTYLIHVIQIQLANPIELLRGSQSGEKEPKQNG